MATSMTTPRALIAASIGLAAVAISYRCRRQTQYQASMKNKSLISINDLSIDEILSIMRLAKHYKGIHDVETEEVNNGYGFAKWFSRLWRHEHASYPKVIGLLFMEPSTRTRCSFEAAAKRLGCSTVAVCDPATSSATKGETIEDTAQMLHGYCDALVVRHPEKGVVSRLHQVLPSTFPIFNAGDGAGEHPTQALLDLFAIEQDFPGRLNHWKEKPIIVTLMGDLAHGRTAHSLSKLLMRFNTELQFLAPEGVGMPSEVLSELDRIAASTEQESLLSAHRYRKISSLVEALESSDVIYATRLQKERLQDKNLPVSFADEFVLTNDLLEAHSPKHQIILHPLPRVNEINVSVDANPRQRYFRQAADGMFVRMALLSLTLDISS